jgi:hypothetical protein
VGGGGGGFGSTPPVVAALNFICAHGAAAEVVLDALCSVNELVWRLCCEQSLGVLRQAGSWTWECWSSGAMQPGVWGAGDVCPGSLECYVHDRVVP